jgi:hypothetical protein
MTLRSIAEKDLGVIMESDISFRWPVTVTDPTGATNATELYGIVGDISELIDADTGQAVSGRHATVAIRTSSLTAQGLDYPIGVVDSASRPWVVEFLDLQGADHVFKVVEGRPDKALGIVNLTLEVYVK